jgi:hypothetical protein
MRAYFASEMARGVVYNCWRCGEEIHGRWDLGHVEEGAGAWLNFKGELGRWPEHSHCNRQTVLHLKQRLARLEAERG